MGVTLNVVFLSKEITTNAAIVEYLALLASLKNKFVNIQKKLLHFKKTCANMMFAMQIKKKNIT